MNILAVVGSQAGAKSYGERGEDEERPSARVEVVRPVFCDVHVRIDVLPIIEENERWRPQSVRSKTPEIPAMIVRAMLGRSQGNQYEALT